MRSAIKYKEGKAWFGDDALTYYYPDLRELALERIEYNEEYDGRFHYNNFHPLLLGIILERATDMSVSEYFETRIWEKIGAQYDASWSVDSQKSDFEKMESGINFRAVDYAKIGSMMLHQGYWNHSQIISTEWVDQSTTHHLDYDYKDYEGTFLSNRKTTYQGMWYLSEEKPDYYAAGKFGQFMYVSPNENTVIIRTGKGNGETEWWPDILLAICERVNELSNK